jgi:hypothetical protein
VDGPASHLWEVHVGVPMLLYEGEQVGLEQGTGREEGQADCCNMNNVSRIEVMPIQC